MYNVTLSRDEWTFLRELMLEQPDGDVNADEIFDKLEAAALVAEAEEG